MKKCQANHSGSGGNPITCIEEVGVSEKADAEAEAGGVAREASQLPKPLKRIGAPLVPVHSKPGTDAPPVSSTPPVVMGIESPRSPKRREGARTRSTTRGGDTALSRLPVVEKVESLDTSGVPSHKRKVRVSPALITMILVDFSCTRAVEAWRYFTSSFDQRESRVHKTTSPCEFGPLKNISLPLSF